MNEHNPSKFARYRARKKAAGLREVRMWVPDLRSPELYARLEREAQALRKAASERDAMDFIEAVVAEDPELYR